MSNRCHSSESPPPYTDVNEKSFHKILVSDQGHLESPWLKFEFSLDLCAAAELMHTFLSTVDFDFPQLYEPECIANAIRRYENCWIPLKIAQPHEHHIAPVDVQWVWLVHMLSPEAYRSDCLKLTGQPVIDRPFSPLISEEFSNCEDLTKELWAQMHPGEPYDFEASMSQTLDTTDCYQQQSDYNIADAVQRQREFNYQISFPHFRSPTFLEKSLVRYRKYLYLQQLCKGKQFLTPCYGIDLIWHTHQSHPVAYESDMRKILGYLLNHDDTTRDRSPGSKLADGETVTRDLWKETFSESFYYPGTMYKGYCSPRTQDQILFAPVLNWSAFDFVTTFDSVEVSDVLLNSDQRKMKVRVCANQNSSKPRKIGGLKMHFCQEGQFKSNERCTIDAGSQLQWKGLLETVSFRVSAYSGINIFGRKHLRQMEAECPYGDLAPETVANSHQNLSLKLADHTGCPISGTLKLTTSAASAAIFDINLHKFERLTLDQNSQLYNFCASSARDKEGFLNDPSILQANHILTERRTGKQFYCDVIHSAPAVMSQILLYDGSNVAVSVQLVGPEALPKPEDIEEADRPWNALAPDQRALVIRNKLGDFAVMKGRWVGFKQRILNKYGKLLQAGDSGKLQIYVTYLNKHCGHDMIYTEIDKKATVVELLAVKHTLASKTIWVSSAGWVLEQVGLMLSVGLLMNLCNPDRVQTQVVRNDFKILPCLRWPLVLMTGYGAESPSNKYFEFCRRQTAIRQSNSMAQSQDSVIFFPYYCGYYDPFLFTSMDNGNSGLCPWDIGVNQTCVITQIIDDSVIDSGFTNATVNFDGTTIDSGFGCDVGACGSGGGPNCGGPSVISSDGCGANWGAANASGAGGFCGGGACGGVGGGCGGGVGSGGGCDSGGGGGGGGWNSGGGGGGWDSGGGGGGGFDSGGGGGGGGGCDSGGGGGGCDSGGGGGS